MGRGVGLARGSLNREPGQRGAREVVAQGVRIPGYCVGAGRPKAGVPRIEGSRGGRWTEQEATLCPGRTNRSECGLYGSELP